MQYKYYPREEIEKAIEQASANVKEILRHSYSDTEDDRERINDGYRFVNLFTGGDVGAQEQHRA